MSETADPIVNALNRPFWDGAVEGLFMLPHCMETGNAFWPPSPVSPFPSGRAVEWRPVVAKGTLLASVTYRRPFQQAFAHLLPYGIAMVALDCGPRFQVHVRDPDSPEAPRPGDRVTLRFERLLDGGLPMPVAHPITD